jgi:UDP-N-acetylglucosamine transferase subunit ALG13
MPASSDSKIVAKTQMSATAYACKGTGTILEAMRVDVPLIVVPNPKLLHNHQLDLAVELEKQGYLIHGTLE